MAVTETVKILFEADTKAITDTTEDLVKLKKITQEEADALKKLGEEAKKTAPAIGGLGDELDHLGGSLPKVTDDVDNVNQSFVSLRTQIKQAKEEVQRAEAAFGEWSIEAKNARATAGQLVDKLGDMNRQLNLLNPEAKAKAFVNFGNNIVGAFQVATGALQAFGSENEQVQKIAMKLQGALNVAQGIASLKGLKESYQDIKIVLGVTTAAQTTLNTTQTAGAVTTTGLTRAFQALRAAMLSNPFTAIAVAIGAVVGAMILLNDETKSNTELTKENAKAQEDARKEYINTLDERSKGIKSIKDEVAVLKGELTPLQAKLNELTRKRREELSKTFDIVGRTQINNYYDLLEQREKLLDAQRKKTTPAISPRPKNIDLTLDPKSLDDATQQLTDQINNALDQIQPQTVKIGQTAYDLNQQLFDKTDKLQQERLERSEQLFAASQDFILSLSQSYYQREQQELESQRDKGIITEEQYQEKLKKIKQNQARQDKELAIFAATVSLAEAIVKALTIKPPASFAAAAATAAIAGLNLAKIIATPLPKFKDGTLAVPGVDTGQDSVMAMLRPGEAVIPTETNREYAPVIRAIYRRDINAKELNDFVTNREQGAFAFNQVSLDALYKRDLKVSAITGAGRTAQPVQPTRITADVDVQQLSKAMSKNKAVEVTNTAALGEAIAAQLSKRINPRQVI